MKLPIGMIRGTTSWWLVDADGRKLHGIDANDEPVGFTQGDAEAIVQAVNAAAGERTFLRNINEALNTGDGVYRP